VAAELELTGAVVGAARVGEIEIGQVCEHQCGGDATGVLDCGWEAAEAANNGEQEVRRSSGGASCSGRRKRSRMGVRECKSESVGSSGMCFKSRRRHGEREQVLASSAARVAARATAVRRGGARIGLAEAGKRWARVLEGTWREVERHGAAGAQENGRRGRRGRARRRIERGGAGG
jgi:hypothetical protein